jgi:allantoin racemase
MLRLIREHEVHYDAFVIACHCDPNLDLCKEITAKPVVGIGEASMKIASMLGHRFSVLSTSPDSVPNKQALVHRYGLDSSLASVHAPKTPAHALDDLELFLQLGREAIQNDGAEVLVLGCAGLCELSNALQTQLGVPVLDGVVCGLIIAEGLVLANYTTSKICRYKGNKA